MKNRVFFLLILMPYLSFTQNFEEIDKITKSYNKNSVASLMDLLNVKKINKEIKVNNFLSYSKLNREYKVGNFKYYLCDIIDGKPIYLTNNNRLSALASKTNSLYPNGNLGLSLTGQGMTVGVWDGGWVLKNHQEFLNNSVSRVTTLDAQVPNPETDLHATHVAGTVGAKGVVSNARGMAYEVNIKSYNWTNDDFEVVNEVSNNGLLISNHSYGVPVLTESGEQNVPSWYMGCYNSDASDWDAIHATFPFYLQVVSAGNSGMETYPNGLSTNLDKLTGEKNSKNNLVVANANPTVHPITGVMSNLDINISSSQGPSDDGRIKPDIAADGTNVYSTGNSSVTNYETLSGTSMASPSTAGSLILLQQHYNNINSSFMKSSTLKGLVCHTATDDSNSIGPDPYFGWGLLNTRESAILITNDANVNQTSIVDEKTLNQNDSYSINVVVNNPQLLKATICWTDPAGTPKNNMLNSPIPALVNDLDLRIIKDTEINFPWKLQLSNITAPAVKGDNTVDNVEKVEVENAVGTYTIQVTHKGTLTNGSQNYSLIISGFDSTLSNKDFNSASFSIYPNPTNDIINVNSISESIIKYSIYDLQGRLVNSDNVNNINNFSIDLSNYLSGVYVLEIQSENGKYSQKIVKK